MAFQGHQNVLRNLRVFHLPQKPWSHLHPMGFLSAAQLPLIYIVLSESIHWHFGRSAFQVINSQMSSKVETKHVIPLIFYAHYHFG